MELFNTLTFGSFLIYYSLAVIGIILHILMKLSQLEERGEYFKFNVWIQKNKFRTIFSFVGAAVLILLLASMPGELTVVSSLLSGLSTDSTIKNLIKEPGIDKTIANNQKPVIEEEIIEEEQNIHNDYKNNPPSI